MTDGAALLAAIRAHPDEDVPRLAYADWLTENGRAEEGEFVRVQCRLAAVAPDDPDHPELLAREDELKLWLGAHAPVPPMKLRGGLSIECGAKWWADARRGFPRTIELKGSSRARGTFARSAGVALKKVFAQVPTRWLTVGAVSPGQLADLLREPVIAQLERLSVWTLTASEEQADEMGRILAAAPNIRNLRGFFPGVWFGEAALEALSRAEFPRLEAFSLDAGRVDAAGMRTLGRAAWFKNLRELYIDRGLTDEPFAALAGLGPFPHLHTLDLSHDSLAVASWEAFARSKAFPRLKSLDLTHTDMSRGRMAALASATGFALHALNLFSCAIGDSGAAALAQAPWAESLRVLNLKGNNLAARGARAVVESPRLANLRSLKLTVSPLGERLLKTIAVSPTLRGLTELHLTGHGESARTMVTVEHGRNFLAALNMPDLRHLRLDALPLGEAGARLLAAEPKFAQLTRLGLPYCGLGDAGAAALLASPQLHNLIELDLSNNGITDGAGALADPRVLPRLAVCRLQGNPLTLDAAERLNERRGIDV